ncbi:MAG: class I SAM-dependent DNA methyltransferase [Candidatus Absconditabacteria bacterium]
MSNFGEKTSLIWNIANLLWGGFKKYEYQDIVLPFTVLRRLDCVLEKTKPNVLELYNKYKDQLPEHGLQPILCKSSGFSFYNTSVYDFNKLLDDPKNIGKNLQLYVAGFSTNVQEILEKFNFNNQIERLGSGNILYKIVQEFAKVNLHIDDTKNSEMGYIFEELIRKFSEQSNETAGEHFTPREVIKLCCDIMFSTQRDQLDKPQVIKTIFDCCCGTGGMLSTGKEYIKKHINDKANIELFGQESNPQTYAICKSDMLIKGENPGNIRGGDKEYEKASSLSNDQFRGMSFDYMITNPPFGVEWKKDEKVVKEESQEGFSGRFGAGTPRISDGQLLFLQHLISKMKPKKEGGSKISIIFNGSPLFTGDAGSGESEIRRWIIQNDMLEAVIGLPDQLFYNTGIYTYIWVINNNKENKRKGKIQMIDARQLYNKMRKSLGNKRHEITYENRMPILDAYVNFEENDISKIFENTDLLYRQITIERPLKLNFQVNEERIENLKAQSFFVNYGVPSKKSGDNNFDGIELQNRILEKLANINDEIYKDYSAFSQLINNSLEGLELKKADIDKIIMALSQKDEEGNIMLDNKGNPLSDSELRDTENVPYGEDIYEYFEREVKPFVPDAWINEDKKYRDELDGKIGKVGCEISFTKYFYKYVPPRSIEEIEKDIEENENELLELLKDL